MNFSITELKFILENLTWLILILASLLFLLSTVIFFLSRLTQTHARQTDLDLIGESGKVTRAIKPPHSGKITGHHAGQSFVLPATSAQPIKSGQQILITAIDNGTARVIPAESESA